MKITMDYVFALTAHTQNTFKRLNHPSELHSTVPSILREIQNEYNESINLNFQHYSYTKDTQIICNYIDLLNDEEFNENIKIEVDFDKLLPEYADKINLKGKNEHEKLKYLKNLYENSKNKIDELKKSEKSCLQKIQILENLIKNENLTEEQNDENQIKIDNEKEMLNEIHENIEKLKKFTIVNFYNPFDKKFTNDIEDEKLILKIEEKLKFPFEKLLTIFPDEFRHINERAKSTTLKNLRQKIAEQSKNAENFQSEIEKLSKILEDLSKGKRVGKVTKKLYQDKIDENEDELKKTKEVLKILETELIKNDKFYATCSEIGTSFTGHSKLKPMMYLISYPDSEIYEKSIVKRYYHGALTKIMSMKVKIEDYNYNKKFTEYNNFVKSLKKEYDALTIKPCHTLILITYRDYVFIVDALFDGIINNIDEGLMDRVLPNYPGARHIEEILSHLGYMTAVNRKDPPSIPINPVFEIGTRFTSAIITDRFQLRKILNGNKKSEALLSKERKKNKNLAGLPYYKERTRFCTSTNPTTNTCDCTAFKQQCTYEFRCKICLDKFKSQQAINPTAEYYCDCIYYTNDYKPLIGHCDYFIYYCRNPKIQQKVEKPPTPWRHTFQNILLYSYIESVRDPETCRQAAISFASSFAEAFAQHGFYAFEMMFGKLQKFPNFYPLGRSNDY